MDRLRERSQEVLETIESCIISLLEQNPEGLRNAEIAEMLGLHSDMNGGQKGYLTWSILGLLMGQKRVERVNQVHGAATRAVYVAVGKE
jgi:hypothetical protein